MKFAKKINKTMALSNPSHVSRVQALYKAILKLHRALPINFQAIGDQYVKDEFRRNKTANDKEAQLFMHEWTKYYVTLAQQIGRKRPSGAIGEHLSAELLDSFNTEQILQLHELFIETQKPLKDQ